MKTRRVNLPDNPKKQGTIDTYLTGIYNKPGDFSGSQKLYEQHRKVEETQEYTTNIHIKRVTTISDKDLAWEFFLYLSIGVKEAAFYLATSFWEGFGTIQNDFLAYLSMAIGVKLNDQKSIELVGDEEIPQDAMNLADKCVIQIHKNAKAVGKRQITYEEAIGQGKTIDKILKAHSQPSFEDNILLGTIKGYADYVALVEDSLHPEIGTHSENSDETHCYIDKDQTILRTADNLYKDFKEKIKPFIKEIKEGNLTPKIKQLCSGGMLAFMYGKVEVATLLVPIYAALSKENQDNDYNYLLLCATRIELDSKARQHRDYQKILSKKDDKYKLNIENKAKELASYVKQYEKSTNEEITDEMVTEIYSKSQSFFPNDPIMKQFSDITPEYPSHNIGTPHHVSLEHGNYPNDSNNHDGLNKVDITGEDSSSCFKCTII